MMDNEPKPSDQKATKVPLRDVTVPDATHTRFRKPMCRCSEEGHSTFALNTLHDHFSNLNHRSLNSCVLCGSNEVYEYYFISDRHVKRIYHNCSPPKLKSTPVPPDSPKEKDSDAAEPISRSPEISDAESSGIGTGFSSMVSILNGRNDDGQNADGLLSKSSHSLSDLMSNQDSSPSGSQQIKPQ